MPHPRVSREFRYCLAALALALPATVLWVGHYAAAPDDRIPTGFVQYDQPYYMANAREYFDDGACHLLYGSPFSCDYKTPRLYFQPQTFLLGVLLHLTGIAPGLLFVLFGLAAAWVCARVALALYAQCVGLDTWPCRLGVLVFFWGGGLLTVAGFLWTLPDVLRDGLSWSTLMPEGAQDAGLFRFDPFGGWWFLNFGRNLVYPFEAYYHALFFGAIWCVVRARHRCALALALLLAASHPFTGIELLAVLCAWSALERLFVRSQAVSPAFLAGLVALIALHVFYYLIFLNRFPEHRLVSTQWALGWGFQAQHFLLAYSLVGAFAYWRLRDLNRARDVLGTPANRLLLVWFLVAFLLANHEFAVKPLQPLHFTRGYIWTPLFLLGAPAWNALFESLLRRRRVLAVAAIGSIMAVALADNAAWLTIQALRSQDGFRLSVSQQALLQWLALPENEDRVILSDDIETAYLATAYTPLRAWFSHRYNTPDPASRERELGEFFFQGRFDARWRDMPLLVVVRSEKMDAARDAWLAGFSLAPVYQNPEYAVYRSRKPAGYNSAAGAPGSGSAGAKPSSCSGAST